MRPDAAKFIIGNAQRRHGPHIAGGGAKPTKKLQACRNDCRVMPGGTPFPKVLGRGCLKTSASARKLSPRCQSVEGDKKWPSTQWDEENQLKHMGLTCLDKIHL